ncbi:hypothetical protein ACPPVS_13540 [Cellulomonas sp. McL0617]|uniref:hypothetical protein n=1 Tax=Cellulomonas sp. McL0617 TaxID=3415675 RepID=UPI003CED3713
MTQETPAPEAAATDRQHAEGDPPPAPEETRPADQQPHDGIQPDSGQPAPAPTRGRQVAIAAVAAVRAAWPHALAGAIAFAAALWTYRPWAFGSAVATPSGDSLAFHAWVQNIIESGWYEHGTRLAAPFGQNSHSYSVTDELLFGFVGKILAPLTGSAGAAVTWAVILSFPAAAVLAVVAARTLRVSRVASVLVGVAFALLPDHFIRATGHFSLAQSWVVPIGVIAATSLVHPFEGKRRRRYVIEGVVLFGCVCISLVNAYYAVFAGLLIAGAALGAWRKFGFRHAVTPTALRAAALGVPLAVAMWMDKLYLPSPLGYPSIALSRSAADADVYSGKLLAFLLPAAQHRSELFRNIRNSYDSTFPNPAEQPALGTVATVAFLALMIWAVLVYWRPRAAEKSPILATLAALTWVAIICYTVGGIGELWAFVLNGGGLRAWSRMHVYIALLALLAAGVTLDKIRRRWVLWATVGALVLVAVVDQTSPWYRPDPGVAVAMQKDVSDFTSQIQGEVPSQSLIYQYPDVSFPLSLTDTTPASAYDGFLPYLYSDGLRWSYGGLQGDPKADWQTSMGLRPMAQQAALLQAAGFKGLVIDTTALTSNPTALDAAHQALGSPDVTSSSGRWEFYRLDGSDPSCVAGTDDLADVALAPPILYPGAGTHPTGNVLINDQPGPGTLRILTLRPSGWGHVDTEFTIEVPPSGLRVTWPDGTQVELAAGTQQVQWSGALPRTETVVGIERLDGSATPYRMYGFSAQVGTGAAAEACLAARAAPATS